MNLIIDISEEDYRECKFRKDLLSLGEEPTDLTFNMRMETLIANGTELPKGHGRLIDADALRKGILSWGMNDYEPSDFIDEIDMADVIIEAESEELKGE